MKRLRKWILVSVCAGLGAVSLPYVTCLVLRHVNWGAFFGLKQFDWVSYDAAVAYLVLGFIMGVSSMLGVAGGLWVGQRLDHASDPVPSRQRA